MKQVLALFSKFPQEGFSKTRLGNDLGHFNAARFSNAFLRDFIEGFKNQDIYLPIHFEVTPKSPEVEEFFKLIYSDAEVSFQDEEVSFFERLKNLFERFDKQTFVHLTGSDIPDFPFEILDEVNDEADVFIGPDLDGGFYYLGAKAECSDIFCLDIEDGETTVFDNLVRQCEKLKLKVKVLKRWSDIDTEADLIRCLERNKLADVRHTFELYSSLRES